MRKKIFIFFFISIVLIFSCKKEENKKIKVSATIYPLYDVIKNLADDTINVSLIIPPNSSPHTFEPVPDTFKNISQSKIIFMIGLSLEVFMEKIKKQNPEIKYVELGKIAGPKKFNINLVSAEEDDDHKHKHKHDHEHQKHTHSHQDNDSNRYDPHVWLDPINFIKIVEIIRDELININPEKKDLYQKNSDLYIKKLNELDKKIKATLENFKDKAIITFHDAFMYFSQRYGLKVVAVFEPWPGKEPGLLYRKKLVDTIKKYKVKAIFYEPQFNKAPIVSLQKETNIKIGELDPLGSPDIEARKNYIELMEFNLNSLRNALSD